MKSSMMYNVIVISIHIKKGRAARTSGGPARVQHSIGPHVARGGFLSTVMASSSWHRRTLRANLSWYATPYAV